MTGWLRAERASLAADQLLDAAGELFAERGVAAVGMADVAAAAGCSRATLYRYFESREALRTAFVHRETWRIGASVAEQIAGLDDPGLRLVEAITTALRLVRDDPILAAWFTTGDSGTTARLAQSSEVIAALTTGLLGDLSEPVARRRARWVVRIIVSLLTDPEPDPAEERTLIEQFVVPVVVRSPG